jgi:hypothetical protein
MRAWIVVAVIGSGACKSKPSPDTHPTRCRDGASCVADCERGVARGCERAAFIYGRGRGVTASEARARELTDQWADLGERACDGGDAAGCGIAIGALADIARDRLGLRGIDSSRMRVDQLARSEPDLSRRYDALVARRGQLGSGSAAAASSSSACDAGDDFACLSLVRALLPAETTGRPELPDAGWKLLEDRCAANMRFVCEECWRSREWRPRATTCGVAHDPSELGAY